MIKYISIVSFLLALACQALIGQQKSFDERKEILSKADLLLEAYIKNIGFTTDDVESNFDEEKLKNFKSLFTSNSTIETPYLPPLSIDSINFDYLGYLSDTLNLDEYFKTIRKYYPKGFKAGIQKITGYYEDIDKGELKYIIEQTFQGKTFNDKNFNSLDAFVLDIRLNNTGSIKIRRIVHLYGDLNCIECDSDNDGINDFADHCPNVKGLEKFDGCPDLDKDGVPYPKDIRPDLHGLGSPNGDPGPDPIAREIVASFNLAFGNSSISNGSFESFTQLQNLKNQIDGSFSGSFFRVACEVSYFFSDNGRLGIGTGLFYQRNSPKFEFTGSTFKQTKTVFFEAGDLSSNYKSENNTSINYESTTRLISASENASLSYISFPLLLKFRGPRFFKRQLRPFVDAGLVFNLLTGGEANTKSIYDYETTWDTNEDGDLGRQDIGNWSVSESALSTHGTQTQIENQIRKLQAAGYEVGLGQNTSGTQGIGNNSNTSLLIRPGLHYTFLNHFHALIGISILTDFQNKGPEDGDYVLANSLGSYNSSISAAKGIKRTSLGLYAGIALTLD